MQHVGGSISNTLSSDLGDFITIGALRVRQDLIASYVPCPIMGDPDGKMFGLKILIQNGWIGTAIGTPEEVEKELARLDWIFEKEKRK